MATQPEVPAQPTQPPSEAPMPSPDVDVPSPAQQPTTQPPPD